VAAKSNLVGDALAIQCDRCGQFTVTGTALATIGASPNVQSRRYLLSALTRQASDQGNLQVIRSDEVEHLLSIAAPQEPRTPQAAMDRMLLLLHSRIQDLRGEAPFLHLVDYTNLFLANSAVAFYVRWLLIQNGFAQAVDQSDRAPLRLTLSGWTRIDELRRTSARPNQAFVAMSFDRSLDEVRETGFLPALEAKGYKPMILISHEHNSLIDDVILAEIRRSGLVVADFTLHRGGVYFECGFAMGLEIPVIRTCRESDFDDLHFDVEHYNVIKWMDPTDLRTKLERRIEATMPSARP
jgi:hypothetical protein